MERVMNLGAVIFYILSIASIVPNLWQGQLVRYARVASFCICALCLHGISGLMLVLNTETGQNLSIINLAVIMNWLVSVILTFSVRNNQMWWLLPIAYGFSICYLVMAQFIPSSSVTHLEASPTLLMHVSIAVFSYAILMIAALYSIQLVLVEHHLKNKTIHLHSPNQPIMKVVERQCMLVTVVGLLLLTFTLVSGMVFQSRPNILGASSSSIKTLFSWIAWLDYAILVYGHYRYGWRGKKIMQLCLLGSAALTLGFVWDHFC